MRRYLVNLPWPQPWLIEALLYVVLYRFQRFELRTDPGRCHQMLRKEEER